MLQISYIREAARKCSKKTLCETQAKNKHMTSIVKIALHIPTGQFMHIDSASNGLSCDCECLKCGEKLEAVQGEFRTKHFRHNSSRECLGSHETSLHELGKQILVQHGQIRLPIIGQIAYSEPKAEQMFEKIRPDVTAIYDERPICFEIFVSHLVDKKKDEYIKSKQLKCVEIDLSSEQTSTYDEIKRKVLESIENKRIVFWEPENLQKATRGNEFSFAGVLAFIGLFVGLSWLFRRK